MKNDDAAKESRDDAVADPQPLRATRRQFLKRVTTGTVAIGAVSQSGCAPPVPPAKTSGATDTTTVCPFCGVGCGQVVSTRGGQVVNIEGDPGHPISEGTLCSTTPTRCAASRARRRTSICACAISTPPPSAPTGRARGCTPWARPSTATAPRTSGPTPSCSFCSATLRPLKVRQILRENCVSCHSARRLGSTVSMEPTEIQHTIERMQTHPGANIPTGEFERIAASLLVLRCARCHGEETLNLMVLKTQPERIATTRRMAALPGSGVRPDQVLAIAQAFEKLIGDSDRGGALQSRDGSPVQPRR